MKNDDDDDDDCTTMTMASMEVVVVVVTVFSVTNKYKSQNQMYTPDVSVSVLLAWQ